MPFDAMPLIDLYLLRRYAAALMPADELSADMMMTPTTPY